MGEEAYLGVGGLPVLDDEAGAGREDARRLRVVQQPHQAVHHLSNLPSYSQVPSPPIEDLRVGDVDDHLAALIKRPVHGPLQQIHYLGQPVAWTQSPMLPGGK